MATELPNPIPLGVIIMEALTLAAVLFVLFFLYRKYFERRRETALTLAVAFNFWLFGGISLLVGGILQYIYRQPEVNSIELFQFTPWGINLGYLFSAISNIFIVLFVSKIFAQSPMFRRTQKAIPIINGILNGITIGLVINTLILDLNNPEYPLGQTIYHLILTFLSFILLIAFSFRARSKAMYRWEKAGFSFIIGSGISGIFIYLFFAIDIVVQEFIPSIFGNGYTIFNYLGWISAIFMCYLGYAGYVMPPALRKQFSEEVN